MPGPPPPWGPGAPRPGTGAGREGAIRSLLLAGGLIGGVVITLVVVAIVALGSNRDDGDRLGRRDGPDLVLPSEPPGWDTISDPPEVEPFALGPAPLWGSATGSAKPGPVAAVRGAAIRDDVAVVWGSDDLRVDRLSVVDLATGTERWGLGVLEDLPGQDAALFNPFDLTLDISGRIHKPAIVEGDDGSWSVVAAYLGRYNSAIGGFVDCELVSGPCMSSDPTGEQGVAALAGSDGRVLWTASVVPGVAAGQVPTEAVLGVVAGADTVLVVVGDSSASGPTGERGLDGTRVVALDAATGQQRWEADAVWPVGVSGDTVLGMEGGRPFDVDVLTDAADMTVVALDARTGERRWDRQGTFPLRMTHPIADDLVVVEVPAEDARSEGQTEVLVLEISSGDEVVSFGIFASGCMSDGASLIACSVMSRGERDRLATFRVDDREAGVAEHELADLYVDAVWRDSVFVTSWDPATDDNPDVPRQLVDLAGRPVAEDLPGTVLASSDRYVILSCGEINVPCPDDPASETLVGRYGVHEIVAPGGG